MPHFADQPLLGIEAEVTAFAVGVLATRSGTSREGAQKTCLYVSRYLLGIVLLL